jgi:hypothetical protein
MEDLTLWQLIVTIIMACCAIVGIIGYTSSKNS